MHMHLVMFQILDRQGFTIDPNDQVIPTGMPVLPPPEEAGWKDTAQVDPGEMVRVIARFEDFKGRFAYHCHIAEHEDNEMMRQFETVQCGDLIMDPTEVCDYGDDIPGDGCSEGCDQEDKAFFSGFAAVPSVMRNGFAQ